MNQNQNVAQEHKPLPKQPEPKIPVETNKKEPIPKLRPVAKLQQNTKPQPQRPKSALIPPMGPLKPLQPLAEPTVKQGKTTEVKPLPSYEYVTGPPREIGGDDEPVAEDLYSTPVKDNVHKPAEKTPPTQTSPFQKAIDEDLYGVPGQVCFFFFVKITFRLLLLLILIHPRLKK